MKLIFELSGEYPRIPFCEIECVGKLLECADQVAVAECPDPSAAERLAMTHVIMDYLGECSADRSSFEDLLKSLNIKSGKSFAGRVKKISGTAIGDSQLDLERCVGSHISGQASRQFRLMRNPRRVTTTARPPGFSTRLISASESL